MYLIQRLIMVFFKDEKNIPIPKWVTPFLEHYEKSKKYDHLIKEVFKVVKVLEKDKTK